MLILKQAGGEEYHLLVIFMLLFMLFLLSIITFVEEMVFISLVLINPISREAVPLEFKWSS